MCLHRMTDESVSPPCLSGALSPEGRRQREASEAQHRQKARRTKRALDMQVRRGQMPTFWRIKKMELETILQLVDAAKNGFAT
jgi:hypothetical protein